LYDAGLGSVRGKRALAVITLAQKFAKSRNRIGQLEWEGSAKLLADDAKVSKTTARQAIDYLTEKGFVNWELGLFEFLNGAITGQQHSYYYPTNRMMALIDAVDPYKLLEKAEADCLIQSQVSIVNIGEEIDQNDLFSYWEQTAETIGGQNIDHTCLESRSKDIYPTPTVIKPQRKHIGNKQMRRNEAIPVQATLAPAPLRDTKTSKLKPNDISDMPNTKTVAFPFQGKKVLEMHSTQKRRDSADLLELEDHEINLGNMPIAADGMEARELILIGLEALIISLALRQKDPEIISGYDFECLENAPISTLAKAVFNSAYLALGANIITSGAFAKAVKSSGTITILALLDTTLKKISRTAIPIKNPFGYWRSTVKNSIESADPITGLGSAIKTHSAVVAADLRDFLTKTSALLATEWVNGQAERSAEEILEAHKDIRQKRGDWSDTMPYIDHVKMAFADRAGVCRIYV